MSTGIKVIGMLTATAGLIAGGALAFRAAAPPPRSDNQGPKLRIVSVAPSVTEMLFSLGVGDCVVGVTEYCDFPPEAKQIECVGEFGKPNVERLLALSPDLVVAAGLERKDLLPILRDAGIGVLELDIRNLDEVFQGFRQLGQAVGQPERAEAVVAQMHAELADIAAEYAPGNSPPRPRVFVEIWGHPLTTVGGTSYLDDMITRAGGVNVAHDIPQAYAHVNAEKVIEWSPDVIVATRMTQPGDPAAAFANRIGWADIPAVKNQRIIADIPTDFLFRPGPRLIQGVRLLAQRLHEPSHSSRTRSN